MLFSFAYLFRLVFIFLTTGFYLATVARVTLHLIMLISCILLVWTQTQPQTRVGQRAGKSAWLWLIDPGVVYLGEKARESRVARSDSNQTRAAHTWGPCRSLSTDLSLFQETQIWQTAYLSKAWQTSSIQETNSHINEHLLSLSSQHHFEGIVILYSTWINGQ